MKGLAAVNGLRAVVLLMAGGLTACGQQVEPERDEASSGDVTNGDVVSEMLERLGGEEALRGVENLVMVSSGTRKHLGQIPSSGATEPLGNLSEHKEIIDLENGQAAFDYDIVLGDDGLSQERTEVYLEHQGEMMGWGTTNGRPNHVTSTDGLFSWAAHNSPEWLLRRNVVTMALAGLNADPDGKPMATVIDGNLVWVVDSTLNDEEIELYIDQDDNLLSGWHSVDTETMEGDTEAVYNLSGYREVGDLMLPHALRISKTDGIYLDLRYEDISINEEGLQEEWFQIPEEVTDQAEEVLETDGSWVNLEWEPVTDNVTHVVAFSHHSMVVELPEFVVVVEAPYTQAQSNTMLRMIEERIGKPVEYVVPTHTHYDHTGGVRAMAAAGATVLTAEGHEDEMRNIVESSHTNPPDDLARRREEEAPVGEVEIYSDSTEIESGDRLIEIYEASGIPHMEPMALIYVPDDKVLFQSDLFFGAASDDAQALYTTIIRYGLEVEHLVNGHSPVMPFSALSDEVGNETGPVDEGPSSGGETEESEETETEVGND